jgi:hypothetical protein
VSADNVRTSHLPVYVLEIKFKVSKMVKRRSSNDFLDRNDDDLEVRILRGNA